MSAARAPLGLAAWPGLARVVGALAEVYDDVQEAIGHDEWRSRCPMHAHTGRDLLLTPDEFGRAVLSCAQSCDPVAIATAGGFERRDISVALLEIERSGDASSAAPSRFVLLTDLELEQLPPITFLVDGVLPVAGLGAIYGPPGAGKSFLALDMALSVAAGASWLGRATRQGGVVYVAAEGSAGLRQRLGAWKRQQGIEGVSLPVYFVTEPANLLTPADLAQLLAAFKARALAPALVIIDTLHRSMPGGDENSAKDMGLVIEHSDRLRRTTGAAVLLVHHNAKGSELERGSTSLRGGVDALLYAKAEESRRELRCEKAKDWPPFPPIAFELRSVGDSCVVAALESGDSYGGEGITAPMRQALTILSRDFLARGATLSEWRDSSETKPATFYRARTALVRGGYVAEPAETRGGRYRVTESGRSVVGITSHETITKVSPTETPLTLTLSQPRRGDSDERKEVPTLFDMRERLRRNAADE